MALAADVREKIVLPAFCAPMFYCSNAPLAIECCKAGIIGSITANHLRGLDELDEQLREIHEALARFSDENPGRKVGPLAVNISPNKDAEDFRRNLDICKRYGTSIIVTSVGNPTKSAPLVRDYGMLHFHDVTNLRFAEKAAKAGVDGMIAIGAGGGGHAGTISHLTFVPKIREMFDGTIVMAGAVSTGATIRAAEVLGADLAYIGTRFIATKESAAPDRYKAMLVEAGVQDVIYTDGVNGMPASWLKASLREVGLDPDNLIAPDGHSSDHLSDSQKPWKDIWSGGQGAALINDVPTVAELVCRLCDEYVAACSVPDMAAAARQANTVST
ncbi:MAG: nitronate monooxygenase [Sphingomonadaceae bacterium]|nr:nitronate monooxygenase [Sphingomonadaceae bacterium]